MAAMTMTTPNGNKVRTRAHRRYAIVVDNVNLGGSYTEGGTCILRTDSRVTMRRQVERYQRETGRPCWAYDTLRQSRVQF